MRNDSPVLKALGEHIANLSRRRSLPQWRPDIFNDPLEAAGPADGREVVLFADTFNRYFERENLDAALSVLAAGGYRVHFAKAGDGDARPLCCGRTFLSIGQIDEARREMQRTLDALAPYVERGVPVIGLEPSCLLGFRDELPALLKGKAVDAAFGERAAV